MSSEVLRAAQRERSKIGDMDFIQRNHGSAFPRSRIRLLGWQALAVFAAAALFLIAATAQAKNKKTKPLTPEEQFAQRIASLAQPLYGQNIDETGPTTREIQKLVLDHMQGWLEQHAPSTEPSQFPYDVDVRRELESIFSAVRFPLYALPVTFAAPWKGRLLIASGYSLGWSKYDRANVIGLFDRAQGQVTLAAVAHFILHNDLHFQILPEPPSGDFRFLAYGTRLGKSHPRLAVEVYSFDGTSLASLWKTENVYDGKLDVEGDRLMINYMKESEFIEAATYGRVPPRYEALYQLTPKGIELVHDRPVSTQGQ